MFYGSDEDRVNHIKRKIDDLRLVCTVYPEIKAVIKEFDGKVYNKRLGEALEERLKDKAYIYSKKNERAIEICINMKNPNMPYTCSYHTIVWILLDELTDGKRINADLFIESLTESREKYLKEAAELENALPVIDQTKNQLEQLLETYRKIYKTIPHEIADYWNIKYI